MIYVKVHEDLHCQETLELIYVVKSVRRSGQFFDELADSKCGQVLIDLQMNSDNSDPHYPCPFLCHPAGNYSMLFDVSNSASNFRHVHQLFIDAG